MGLLSMILNGITVGDYKLFCEDCGKGFSTLSKLDSHKRKHTGNKGHIMDKSILNWELLVGYP